MAIGTSSGPFGSITGPLGVKTRPQGKTPALGLGFTDNEGSITLVARKPRKNDPSAAQIIQRLKYSDCDCLWKHRDKAQAIAWKKHLETDRRKELEKKDYYRPFMSDCLNFDLSFYLLNYLNAEWQFISLEKLPDRWCIVVRMGSTLDHDEPPENADPTVGGPRII